MCFVTIWVFYVFKRYFGHFMTNEKSESKTDSILEFRMIENLKNGIKDKIIIFYNFGRAQLTWH